jgi:hypothetical protein
MVMRQFWTLPWKMGGQVDAELEAQLDGVQG